MEWTIDKLKRFERVYKKHMQDRHATFTFEGNVFVVGYAKYLIEYLKTRLGLDKSTNM